MERSFAGAGSARKKLRSKIKARSVKTGLFVIRTLFA